MIDFSVNGNFDGTIKYLVKVRDMDFAKNLEKYGEMGVRALQEATPKRTGKTANSWSYEIQRTKDGLEIIWSNDNYGYYGGRDYYVPIAVLIQYGHGTRNGGYVKGIDYINPAMRPIFEKIADDVFKEIGK